MQSKLRFPMISQFVCFPKPIAGVSPELTVNTWNFPSLSLVPYSSGHGFRFPLLSKRKRRILMCSDSSSQSWNVPVLSSSEVVERLKQARGGQQFLAMYSSVVDGITTDPAAMVLPLDDHMVHRGHGVFDTAIIINGYLYELDQHLDRILRSASMAKIPLPLHRDDIRRILIQTVSVSGCRDGSLRYWLSAGPGDFLLSPSTFSEPTLYAIVIKTNLTIDQKGVKVVTSSIPIKPPEFATVKSVNYLPNVLSQMEAEAKGAYAGIWVGKDGFIAEGPNMNVAFVVNGGKELVMPRFDNVLSGCTAKRTLTLAEQLVSKGMLKSVKVMDVTVEDGKKADEMMLLGSGVRIRPVIQWDEEFIGNGKEGPITKALLDLLLEDMNSGPPSIKELNSYVALRKTYMSTLGNKKVELFDMGAGASGEEEGSLMVTMCLKKTHLGKFRKLLYEFLNVSAL